MWSTTPPTYREWRDGKNHGTWWVKFRLTPETTETDEDGESITWPECWLTEVVTVSASYTNGFKHMMQEIRGETPDYSGIKLHASGTHGLRFDLDDSEKTKGMYWQPTKPPDDDGRDQRPTQLKGS